MINLFELLSFIFVLVIIFGLLFLYLSTFFNYKKVFNRMVQAEYDREYYKLKLTEYVSRSSSKRIEGTEGFVRFISDSREQAFKYIEDVQQALVELKDYFDKTGLNMNVGQAEEMSRRIENALSFLPKDSKND
jgi:adenylate kinase family enzyme